MKAPIAPPAILRSSHAEGLPANTWMRPSIATAMMLKPRAARARTSSLARTLSMSAIATPTSTTGRISAPAPINQWVPVEIKSPTGPATSNHTEPPMTAARPISTRPHASAWCSKVLERGVGSSSRCSSSSWSSYWSRRGRRREVLRFSSSCSWWRGSRRRNEPTPRAAAPRELPTTLYAEPTRSSAVSAATVEEVGGCVIDTGPP